MKNLLIFVFLGVAAIGSPALGASVTITRVEQTPWTINDTGTLKSETALTIENGGDKALDAWAKISVAGKPDYIESLGRLDSGQSTKVVHVAELNADGDNVTFALYDNNTGAGTALCSQTLAQQKIRHWRLYVEHNSHQDIGYTDYQEVLRNQKWPSFWDQALLTDMPNSDSWPDDAKVRLEVEGVYQLQCAIPVRSADWFETLRSRLVAGRFAYGAALGDNALSNWGAEELARSAYYGDRFFKDRTGVDSSKNVIMRDEPAMSWGVVDLLAEAGAKSFVLQHNYDHNLWRGTTAYPELFYAQGKNPANRLLVWNALWGSYGEDELNFRASNTDRVMEKISAKLMGYQATGRNVQNGQYAAARAVDGVTRKTDQGEWASNSEQNPWIRLAWPAAQTINKISIYDRPNGIDNVNGGLLSFSDGSSIKLSGIPADGTPKAVTFPDKTVTWIRLKVTDGQGLNVGLSEIQVYTGEKNIAPAATVTASSQYGVSKYTYPYDVAMVNFTHGGDNGPMITQVYRNIKAISDKGYVFPRVICANYKEFFEDLSSHWSTAIPTFKGTVEDWWNFGAASTAYETGLNRVNHDKLSAAETLATFAGVAAPDRRYPYELIANAYENMLLYDEHTWGSPIPAVDNQWRWKRNTAIAGDNASTKVLNDSLAALGSQIPTTGKTIVTFNTLTWLRSDLVTVSRAALPAHFDITDVSTGKVVPYQKYDDSTVIFVATDVPGLGYKTFRVTARPDDPTFPTSVKATSTMLENAFFKLTFDIAGNVTSILDKQNGNAEMIDQTAPHPLNQYLLYKEGALAGQVTSATIAAQTGPVLGSVTADGATTGLDSLRRRVILYENLPRIDFVNDAVKGPYLSNVEIGYFAFPLNVSNFMLRHEMPTGDMRPGVNADVDDPANEQYYSSATAFYTVNKWIDASNQKDWGITFASLQAPLVSYGQPDIGASKGGWKVGYNIPKPWIYSMAFNNEWQTNFQKTQPGRAIFQYSLCSHAGGTWQAGNAQTFGAQAANPFKTALITDAQPGHGLDASSAQFVRIDKDNVVLTTAKLAEANGEGLVLRFNEIKGQPTTFHVDLNWFAPTAVIQTDPIENDQAPVSLSGTTITLDIPAFGFKTVRLLRGPAPQTITGLAAAFDAAGCQVSWSDQPTAACYEVFRGTSNTFTPGTGSYVATVSANHYYDPTVKTGLTRTYYYAVRAVQAGKKGPFSAAAQAANGLPADTVPPSAPVLWGQALHSTKVTLSWLPATDNQAVKGYKVYRDDKQIADLPELFGSWLDTKVQPATTYTYTVKAYDISGNLSSAGGPAVIKTLP
jgi:hypothetical protein